MSGPDACLDGVLGAAAEATIPVADEGLLRGDGVFEVLRLYAGRPFALEDHLARMERSAANLRLPLDLAAVREDVERLLAAADPVDGILRLVVTRGGHRIVLIEPLPELPEPIRLTYVTYAPTRILTQIKSLSYGGNMLATRLAKERGFDEALLVTPHGRVLEAPTSSFFWVRDGALLTPPLDDHILASITREAVIDLMGAEQRQCTREDAEGADEAFLASTVREVMAVGAIEGRAFGAAPGPVTARAAERLREHIAAAVGRPAPA